MLSEYSLGRGASTSSYREESPRLLPRFNSRSFSPSSYSSTYNKIYNSETYPISGATSTSSLYSEKLPPRIPQDLRRQKRTYSQSEDRVGFTPRSMNKLRVIGRESRERSESLEPRRYYPQSSSDYDLSDLEDKDDSSIVLDANLSFVLGCRTKMRQNVKPIPAHQADGTANNALSSKIKNFLRRTDHVMDEWTRMGKRRGGRSKREIEEEREALSKSRSERNIMIKSLKIYSRSSSVARSSSRISNDDTITDCGDATCAEIDEMSDMAADLAEEQSAATLATERLEAETGERLRLERELSEVTTKNKELNRASERLEMELLYARSDLNGISEEDDDDNEAEGGGVYKQRYERVFRELEFTKRRLRQQHEDDLEQLVGLKKQLEKKLNDAYEEAEEQRQVVGQWKNKVQKLNGEMNDLKLLLEEQNARNNLLEKKQRRFDSETQMLNDELKKERNAKERAVREKEVLITEKYSVETALADTRLELDLKEQKLNILQREYDELTCGERTEEEITNLRRQKIELERKVKDQEEELDELASQVQLLEQAKLRLEMTVESMRKEAKKEANLRDEEMEEMRGNAQKRVKALEAQLENEHEERTMLLRQKHELERRLASAAESERHDREGDEVLIRRLKNDLRKTKALLRDCQTQLDMQKADAPGKNVIRQLKNQVEDLECARALAVKIKQSLEAELSDTQSQLEESNRLRRDAEEKANHLAREKGELQSQLEENEEELAEVFKKYKAAIQQMSLDQMALQEQVSLVSELEVERNQLKEQLAELTTKLESAEYMGDASSNLLAKRNEFKVKELESKLDLEQSTRSRLEIQISRLKESVEKLQSEVTAWKTKEQQAQDQIKKLQRSLRETKEELNNALSKEMEASQRKKDLEKRLENLETEAASERNDLKLAKKRIEDLQLALQGELGDSVSDHSESDPGDSDCDSVDTYLPNNRGSSFDGRRFDNLSRSSTSSSNLGKEASFT
ncbi:unconventional myosin-XVIIIa isoform X4 [Coccinella septempunctata]|uniref:unconventional myosin-XVIIIa isoform X4 n=1 Tax=Coccinella septempunctata TaxID=41139 RepID=UPI001D0732A0|nr:unconventional myosin-XVIIIa isoform X4 [Coccinella septempunctata]